MADGRMTAAAFLVAELRRARTCRGLSQDELAKAVNYSASMVSAVELGQQQPTAKYLELVDRALDTGGIFSRMLTELVSLDTAQVWLRGWRRILAEAKVLRWYESRYVPGLFQTEGYARAVFEAGDLLDQAEVERRLAERMELQGCLYGDRVLKIVVVLDEGVLRRCVGDRKTMADQALHLARIATEHPHVRLHIVPLPTGEYPGLGGPFILAALTDDSELGVISGQGRGEELHDPANLRRLQQVWEVSLGAALPAQESVELLREIAESWN
ncbi:helix-turn-helix domain-containing protein [Micromonospora sp. KC606]|uniref:helix-turn-helix domain-containing protein n=1 Tax=Micromonospora sp. KC606 TaxID=2530379 RepID=UPI00104D4ACC|nr:helix-turn-helix transcriptional regulator [Micromonospora sp. KC606]TDC78050.1 helix-turn-helix domain-containing protein [Micromonospora sp. KC606]